MWRNNLAPGTISSHLLRMQLPLLVVHMALEGRDVTPLQSNIDLIRYLTLYGKLEFRFTADCCFWSIKKIEILVGRPKIFPVPEYCILLDLHFGTFNFRPSLLLWFTYHYIIWRVVLRSTTMVVVALFSWKELVRVLAPCCGERGKIKENLCLTECAAWLTLPTNQ